MKVSCPRCGSSEVEVEFDIYIPGMPRTIYEVYCLSCGYEGDPDVLCVKDLPVVGYEHDQISFAQLVQLIGEDAAGDLLCRSHRELGWIVDRYMLSGLWLWVDISWEGEEVPVIRHYYGD